MRIILPIVTLVFALMLTMHYRQVAQHVEDDVNEGTDVALTAARAAATIDAMKAEDDRDDADVDDGSIDAPTVASVPLDR